MPGGRSHCAGACVWLHEPIALWGSSSKATPTGDAVAHVAHVAHVVVVLLVAVTPRGLRSNFGGVSISIHCHLPLGGGFR